jgi:tRNA 2-selenouridine synthase
MEKDLSRETIFKKKVPKISHGRAIVDGVQIVDVRSRSEFESGTLPGAVNIALFDENERSVIGTIYNHGGKEKAIDQGFSYVEDKLEGLLEGFKPLKGRPVAVFCARGGMRSLSIVNLLCQMGYEALQIEGGYKQYRHDTLALLDKYSPALIVIHGLTGTGKTRIIKHLDNSIDLEELACHRSSLFGGLDRVPSSQKIFETNFVTVIKSLGKEPYFVEGESRKIGRVFIPNPFAQAMKRAVLVNVTCSLETRIERIIEDYPVRDEKRQGEILEILSSLRQKMGAARVKEMGELLVAGNLRELVRILLVDYYDKRYQRSMSDYTFDFELSSEDISKTAKSLTIFRSELL